MENQKRIVVGTDKEWYMAIPYSQITVEELKYLADPILNGDTEEVYVKLPDKLGSIGIINNQ